MTVSLIATLMVSAVATIENALDLGSATGYMRKAYKTDLTTGTGAGQADRIWHDQRTLAASASEDLDLAGVLTDALGQAFTLARVKGLIVAAAAANTNDVIVGGAVATQFASWVGTATDKVRVRPGAVLALVAGAGDATGYVTAAGASDLLRVANGGAGTSVTYDVVIVGATA